MKNEQIFKEETIQSILEEGNFIAPRPGLEDDLTPAERRLSAVLLLGLGFSLIPSLVYHRFALLPLLGSILLLLGMVRLRNVNNWLSACFVMSVLQVVWRIVALICDSIPDSELLQTPFMSGVGYLCSLMGAALGVCLYLGIRRALHIYRQQTAIWPAVGALACYALMLVLRVAPSTDPVIILRVIAAVACGWLLHRIHRSMAHPMEADSSLRSE